MKRATNGEGFLPRLWPVSTEERGEKITTFKLLI